MPVTEIATLRLIHPHTWDSTEIRSFFSDVAQQQAAWSGYALHYFHDMSDEHVVYILTGWESVEAHYEWIRSEQNQMLLERGRGLIEVVGLKHARVLLDLERAEYVVLEQWTLGEGEDVSEADRAGSVVEAPGQVCTLQAHGDKPGNVKSGKSGEKLYTVLQRLKLV
ncbi:hypothetical protein BD413DRAFT_497711 [Trametes elegans]|nr:hypothetical protein BD413DRAFT_497711 [Trametes elegans]